MSTPYELWRHDVSADDQPGKLAPISVEKITGHPPIPANALTALRCRVQGYDSDGLRWWHRDGNAWAAVTDLHRSGDHENAVALARLLHWVDRGGRLADRAVFEIREGS